MTRIMLKRLAARFDWPLTLGLGLLGLVLALGLLGRAFWHPELAYPATSLPNMPPLGFTDFRGIEGVPEHPLGTESSGRDMLALIIVGAPNTLLMALVAGLISTLIGVALGFFAGFSRGRLDGYIRLFTDVVMTIPPLLVLIVIQAAIGNVELYTMAVLIALFEWPKPTRQIRAQVMSMRESGYVATAVMSGASTLRILFLEILPNLLPFIAASFTLATSSAVLAAIGLEVLGLGPTRVPTLGTTISSAIESAGLRSAARGRLLRRRRSTSVGTLAIGAARAAEAVLIAWKNERRSATDLCA